MGLRRSDALIKDAGGIMDDMNGFLLTPYARAVEVYDLRYERTVDAKVAKFLLMDYCLQMLKAFVDDDISALLGKNKHQDDLKVFGLWVSLMKVLTGDPAYEDSIEKVYGMEKKTVPFMVFDGPRLIVRVHGKDISGAMDLYLKTSNSQSDTSFNMPFFIGAMLYTTLVTNPGNEAEWEQRWQNMVRELSRAVTLDFLLGYIDNVRPDYRTARQIHNFMWNSPLVEKTKETVERASHTIGPVGYIYKKVHSWLSD